MKWYTVLLGCTALALGTVGATRGCEVEGGVEKKVRVMEIKMIPKSVSKGDYGTGMSMLAIYGEVNGKKVLAFNNKWTAEATQIEALLKAEINDGDKEEIVLRGSYGRVNHIDKEIFSYDNVKVEGHTFK